MIEAVNSAIANSVLVRGGAEQGASSRVSSQAAAATAESRQVILAPYISPFVYVDNQFNKAVLQIRDSDTGEVQRQFPSEQTLQARAAAEDAIEDSQLLERDLARINTNTPSGTQQSATLFAASQFGASGAPANTQASQPSGGVNVAQAQIAAAALSSAATAAVAGGTVNTSV